MQVEINFRWFYKPKLSFMLDDSGAPYDTKTGTKRGSYKLREKTIEHYIFPSEDKKRRRAELEDLLNDFPDTFKEELNLHCRQPSANNNHSSQH